MSIFLGVVAWIIGGWIGFVLVSSLVEKLDWLILGVGSSEEYFFKCIGTFLSASLVSSLAYRATLHFGIGVGLIAVVIGPIVLFLGYLIVSNLGAMKQRCIDFLRGRFELK